MEMMRLFWDAAVDLDPDAAGLDEGSASRSAARRRSRPSSRARGSRTSP